MIGEITKNVFYDKKIDNIENISFIPDMLVYSFENLRQIYFRVC